jgi:hypothetical protein
MSPLLEKRGGEMIHHDLYLQQAWAPDMLGEWECGVCDTPFEADVVQVVFWHEGFLSRVCPSCIEYLGKRNPEKFLTIEEYEEANKRYKEPLWASEEEEEREDPSLDWTANVSLIDRATLSRRVSVGLWPGY